MSEKRCLACSHKILDNSKFCSSCGEKVVIEKPEKIVFFEASEIRQMERTQKLLLKELKREVKQHANEVLNHISMIKKQAIQKIKAMPNHIPDEERQAIVDQATIKAETVHKEALDRKDEIFNNYEIKVLAFRKEYGMEDESVQYVVKVRRSNNVLLKHLNLNTHSLDHLLFMNCLVLSAICLFILPFSAFSLGLAFMILLAGTVNLPAVRSTIANKVSWLSDRTITALSLVVCSAMFILVIQALPDALGQPYPFSILFD